MKQWIAENAPFASVLGAVITMLAGMAAILWIVWQVQYQITESILEAEIRLETKIAESETQLREEIAQVKAELSADIAEVKADLSGLEDKFDAFQKTLDARLHSVELEQAEQRGILSAIQQR